MATPQKTISNPRHYVISPENDVRATKMTSELHKTRNTEHYLKTLENVKTTENDDNNAEINVRNTETI